MKLYAQLLSAHAVPESRGRQYRLYLYEPIKEMIRRLALQVFTVFRVSSKFASLFFVLISPCMKQSYGQYENVWAFGEGAGFDFNSGSPIFKATNISASEGCASVCDPNGQLLFYTEGYHIWDQNGNLMPNGKELLGSISNFSFNPTSSTTQGALIVPMPGNAHKYYVFSLTAWEVNPPSAADKLYYSIVDMNLNGGLGDVEASAKGILMDSSLTEMMTAAVGNHCNVWLLVANHFENKLKAYAITDAGIDFSPVISDLLPANYGSFQGNIKVAPNNKRIAINRVGVGLYDFNPATGTATGIAALIRNPPQAGRGDLAFSPDNSKLYTSSLSELNDGGNAHLYQFDLNSNDSATMVNSKLAVGDYFMQAMKSGPDGKVYTCSPSTGIGVINYPNLAGAACRYMPNAHTAWAFSFPNTVAVIKRDTVFTYQTVSAGCFANVNLLPLRANDTTGWNYEWNTGVPGPSFISVDRPGTYWVSYRTPPCNFNVDTFYVSFPNGVLPDIHIQNACKGFDNGKAWVSTYPGDTVTYHYIWQNELEDTLSLTDTLQKVPSGNYILHVITAHCDTTLSFFLPEEEHKVSFQADSIICQGTELTLYNTSDSSFTQFYWDLGDNNHSQLRNPVHIYKQSGSYEIRLIGIGLICEDTAYKTITVDSLLPGSFLTQPDSICVGQSISFYPQIGSTTLHLHWQFGDGLEMISSYKNKIQHAYEVAGIIPVRLNIQFRVCPDTYFIDTVYVYRIPEIDLGTDAGLCINDASILLQNLQKPSGNYHQLWNTGDTTESLKVVHPGMYSLTVRTEPLGCSNTATIEITKDCYIDIPNAFTPNGDGVNDYFFPKQLSAQKITQFKMKIFNRWGELIFETNKKDSRGWDGQFNGKPQPEGTYVYIINAEINGTRPEHYQGNITLIR